VGLDPARRAALPRRCNRTVKSPRR